MENENPWDIVGRCLRDSTLEYRLVTDGQTDRQTRRQLIPALASVDRAGNTGNTFYPLTVNNDLDL